MIYLAAFSSFANVMLKRFRLGIQHLIDAGSIGYCSIFLNQRFLYRKWYVR